MALVWKHVIYLEVAGWRHRGSSPLQSLNSLLRDVALWHGLGLLQMVGFKASVQRTGARWRAQLRKQEALVLRGSRDSRERARSLARRFKLSPVLDIAHRRLVQSERRYGAEPRLHGCFCKALSCDEKINFYPCIKTYQVYTFIISPHSLSY